MASLRIDNTFEHHGFAVPEAKLGEDDHDNEDNKDTFIMEKNLINVTDFRKEHLPPSCHSNEGFMEYVQNAIDRTVKVSVSFTSTNRPNTYPNTKTPYPFVKHRGCQRTMRYGTGYLEEFCDYKQQRDALCPCQFCNISTDTNDKTWMFTISTSAHLIWDREEAENAVFVLHYNSEDRKGVKYLFGLDICGEEYDRYLTDYCRVLCVTHDEELGDDLKTFCEDTNKIILPRDIGDWNSSTGILISHPQGACKKISVGDIYNRCLLRNPKTKIKLRRGRFCRLPSYYNNHTPEKWQIWDHPDKNSLVFGSVKMKREIKEQKKGPEANIISNLFQNPKILEKCLMGEDLAQLAVDIKVILPGCADYHMKRSIKDDSMHWYVFPPDTKFISPEGATIPFPESIEFYMPNVEAAYKDDLRSNSWYLTYDMASGPGSSGARVLDLFRHNKSTSFHHSGSFPGYKVSGLIRGYYFVPSITDSDQDEEL